MQKNTKLGWIGLGVMGEPMCHHLLDAGFPISVFTEGPDTEAQVRNARRVVNIVEHQRVANSTVD